MQLRIDEPPSAHRNATVKQRDFMDLISGRKRGIAAGLMRLVLRWASFWFWLGANVRLGLYRCGVMRGLSVDAPVICAGNLTTGGTGKTPAVAWVTTYLKSKGRKPAIVSRGYKSEPGAEKPSNDEMRVLEELVPGTPHIQNPDRVAGATRAIHEGADAIVLDDGFSHLRLKRNLDVLLFDSLNPFGFGRMLPHGLMREPLRSVRRADFAIFTRADVATPERLRDLEDTIRCKGFTGGVAYAAHAPVKLVRISDGEELSLEQIEGKTVAPFCGIGNPRGFERTLESLGAKFTPVEMLVLDDHARIDEKTLERQVDPFLRSSREAGAEIAVCTQKDAVKFRSSLKGKESLVPIYELRVEFRIIKGEDDLKAAIDAALES